jgi:hypothetical protein
MALSERIKKQVVGWSQKGMEALFADEKRAMKLANALGAVQRGKQSVDKAQTSVMRQLNFATRSDFKDIGRQLSGLKKRARSLEEKLSRIQ